MRALRQFLYSVVSFLALLGLLSVTVWAQEDGDDSDDLSDVFLDQVQVHVVNVDVYVTDKDGNPVTGLEADDFELYEDDKPMPITNFYAVQGGRRLVDGKPEELPTLRAGVTDVEAIPEDQRLRLVVYIDNFNIRPFNRNRVMRELRSFLTTHLERQDEVMLLSYDRSLHVRRRFTSDPAVIASAMAELERVTGHGVHADSNRRDTLRRIREAQDGFRALSWARSYAEEVYHDLSFSLDALKEAVDTLAGLPGRKAILYVSDGIPRLPGEDLFYAVEQYHGETSAITESFQYDVSRRFRELANQANANGVTFYTIDAAGLRVFSSVSAENPDAGRPGAGIFLDQIYIRNQQDMLVYLADKTGGQAIINRNRVLPALEKVAQDFRTFYSLGYSPGHYGDGRYHKIKVKVKKKGLKVRHRDGYRDKSTEVRMADGTMAALHHAFQDNPLEVDLLIGRKLERQDKHFLVPVHVRIPIGNLVLVPRGEFHEARVRLFLAAMDEKGRLSSVQETPVPIRIPNGEVDKAKDQHYVYSLKLLMRSGRQKVSLGVRDDLSAEKSFISRSLTVGRS